MPVPIPGSVVVITGATSGIGRAAALNFAGRGGRLVLAARSERELQRLVQECGSLGAQAIAVQTDVAEEAQVEGLAATAVEEFGGVDTWANLAGLIAYGTFEDIPSESFRRIIEVNLMGQVHGSRAALPRLRERGGGVLINMSSVWGRVTSPLVSPYVVSKHAARAFSECLRHELQKEDEISVVTMTPQAVDTPIFDHSANYIGRRVVPIPPVIDPTKVAEGVVACAESPKREVNWGRAGRALEVLYAIAPRLYCRVVPGIFMRGSFLEDEAPRHDGTLFGADYHAAIYGGWGTRRRRDLARAAGRALQGLGLGLAGRSSDARPPRP
jgi:NAD(P)-dependent dehydrogenase (short-subunit alcohol dehydrogenase family)